MFDNPRYATKGIVESIPAFMQNILWFMIETLDIEKDHLQVFELSNTYVDGNLKQKIIHRQENPPYTKETIIALDKPLTTKIFVIDDGTHSTMLLYNEY